MDLKGSRTIAADRMLVWKALNDPAILKLSILGCSALTGSAEDGFEAVVTQEIGPVKTTFKGQVALSDIIEGESYRISGQGKAGPAGYAKGYAVVTLTDSGAGTLLTYDVSAKVGGKLASLGARLIDSVAKKLADQFFENFQAAVEGPPSEAASAAYEELNTEGLLSKLLNWFRGLFSR